MISSHIGMMAHLFGYKKSIILVFDIEGHHSWKDAPDSVGFLKHNHRHLFRIRIGMKVSHNDREKEIFLQQQLYQQSTLGGTSEELLRSLWGPFEEPLRNLWGTF